MELQDIQVGKRVKMKDAPTYQPPTSYTVESVRQPSPGNEDGWVVLGSGSSFYGHPPQDIEPWTQSNAQAQKDFFKK